MGWFIDVYVAYLFRVFVRVLRSWGSANWSVTTATVANTSWSPGGFGCSTAEVVYTYNVEASLYSGMNEKPFISPNSAENYAARFPLGSSLIVRIKPGEPALSVVFDRDQTHAASTNRLPVDDGLGERFEKQR